MKIPLLFNIIFLLLFNSVYSQPDAGDSIMVVQQVTALIQQQKFATAHEMLEKYLEENGMRPFFACWMVNNGLQNYYRQENYEFFYLRDNEEKSAGNIKAGNQEIKVARMRYPQRLLEKVIDQNPDMAFAYKILGDYYDIQLKDLSHFEFARGHNIKELEEKTFSFYSQAEKLGYHDMAVNRWLGDYYINKNQLEMAEKYYAKNIKKTLPDAISLFHLAEISFQKKQYTQAYNYSNQSLKYLKPEDIYLKYDALRLSANSLKELGETDRFNQIINDCIRLLPDLQDAYIDLIGYYISRGDSALAEHSFSEMFMKNPFDHQGYQQLEKYIQESKNYQFADSLFDNLIVKYENWDEVLANIYWSRGNIAYSRNLKSDASNFWEISKNYMKRYLPENHSLIKQVGDIAHKK
jgi:uncharacterized protein YozE (UPF0346 family)